MTTFSEFVCSNLQSIVNSIGLVLDIVGAIFVATEVVDQFHGNKFKATAGIVITDYLGSDGTPLSIQQPDETNEYKGWELKKYWRMKVGLAFLIFGFLFQLLSNWIVKLV
jgi:hypothetical protein